VAAEDPIPRTVEWRDGAVRLIDQRELPGRLQFLDCRTVDGLCEAISSLAVRGAPALGAAGAYGVALACRLDADAAGDGGRAASAATVARAAAEAADRLIATRPTAVNLAWGARRVLVAAEAAAAGAAAGAAGGGGAEAVARAALEEAERLAEQDVADNRALGRHGAALVPDGAQVLTHCNAGALATAGFGTALAVVRAAIDAGKRIQVIACETRPFLQGARLTAWELKKDRIPVTLITDNMAGHLMQRERVSCVIVGTDRTAANGDVANKIGTYPLAVLAHRHAIPFYVAAPLSSIDFACPNGDKIPIEERPVREVTHVLGRQIAPSGIRVLNPAFDVTPNELVTAIVTERGIARQPLGRTLRRLVEGAPAKPERKAEARRMRARRR